MSVHHNPIDRVEAVDTLTAALVGMWEEYHPPRDAHVAQLLRDIKRESLRPMAHVWRIAAQALRERRPRAAIERPAREYLALVAAAYPAPAAKPLAVLHRLETKLDAALDLAQMRELTERSRPAARDCLERARDLHDFLGAALIPSLERQVYTIGPATSAEQCVPLPAA